MFEFFDRWQGIIVVLGGIYAFLIAYRILPRNLKNSEKVELWHRKFGKMMKILSPIIIIFGILLLFDIL